MAKEKKKRTREETKELNWKIAEIIWYSIGFIGLVGGFVFSTLGLLIINMEGNFKYHPFYSLYQSQEGFFKWVSKWSDFNFGGNYANLGVMLIVVSVVYLIIVFSIFAKNADIKERKAKKTRDRVRNFKLILDEPAPVTEESK